MCSVENIKFLRDARKLPKYSISLSAMKWGEGRGEGISPKSKGVLPYPNFSSRIAPHFLSHPAALYLLSVQANVEIRLNHLALVRHFHVHAQLRRRPDQLRQIRIHRT